MSSHSESISRVWDACHRSPPTASYARSMNEEPLVSVVRGKPTPEELAALVTVLVAAYSTVDADPGSSQQSNWARSARPSMAATSWRTSALPR
ncbi:MAG: acyl-CoA carboxylase subunit epsilon [Actinoplanes sp.]